MSFENPDNTDKHMCSDFETIWESSVAHQRCRVCGKRS